MYINNVPFTMYWPRLFVIFQEIILLYDVGHQGLEIYPCIKFQQCFSLSVACTYIMNVLADAVFTSFNYDSVR